MKRAQRVSEGEPSAVPAVTAEGGAWAPEESMRLSRLRMLAISLAAVLMLVVGTAGQAFACVAPEPDDNLQFESAVSVPAMSPTTSLTLAVDRGSANPGQALTYTASLTNSGTTLTLTGTIEVTNPHHNTVSLAAWYDYVSFDPKGNCSSDDNDNDGHNSTHWVSLAGAAGATKGYTASGKAPIATGETFSATSVPSEGVKYSTGSDTISGTSIGHGDTARWKFTAIIPLTSSQAAALFKGNVAYPIRASFHAEGPTGNSHDSNAATIVNAPFCRQLTALKGSGSASDMRVAFTLPDGTLRTITKTTVAALGAIAPGASVSVKTSYTVPVPAAKGAGETDSAYIARLTPLDGKTLTASATARSGASGPIVGPAGPVYTTEALAILSLTKAGPPTVEAGATATYSLKLANTSSAPASSILLTDSLPDGANIPVTGTPATLAPGATATAHASYLVPAAQPAGALTDTAKLRWTDASGNWYGPISSNATSTVTRSVATVIVTASGGSLTYGGTIPAVTPSYSGWRTGDGPAVLTSAPVCTTTATSASGAGTYKTSCTGAAAPAYTFVYVDGSIAIARALVTVTTSSGAMTYGGTVPAIAPSYSGWQKADGPSVLTTAPTCSTTATSTSAVGTYKASCTGAAAANYSFAYVDGSVTVTPALVTLTASSDSMTYGATVPAITPSYAGWQNGEGPSVLTTAPTCTTAATSTSPAGTYKSTCSGAAAANYTFAYVEGKVSVNPSVVIVTASSGSLTYGGAIPAITPAYSGWLNGDGPSVLTSAPVCTTMATSTSGVGTYKTTCSGAAAPNYTLTYADGSITITPALLTVTAQSGSMTYGGTIPAITPAYSGWRNGDGPAVLTTAPTCTTTATSASPAGTYKTTCAGAAAPNYTFAYVDGSVAVTPAVVTVTTSSGSMPIGGTVPAITPTYSGWQNGEGPSVLTTAPTCTTTATSASPAGAYKTTCTGAVAPNYTFTYVDGSISVEGVITTGLALTPQSGGPLPLNSTYTLTVTAMGSDGKPVSAAAIKLTITGPNVTSANLTTGPDGTATFTYTGSNAGTDTAQATLTGASGTLASNTASVIWSTPTAAIATSQIHGVFYPVDPESSMFLATPASTPAFAQDFPTVNFDPPGSAVPNDHSGVSYFTRPFTDVTTDLAGNYSGTIIAQGNGVQAGVDSMFGFDAVFTGTYTVAAAGNQTFNYFSDDGWMLAISGGATPVSGPWVGTPASGLSPFNSYPLMASYNIPSSPAPNTVTVYFPAPGVYPYEIDYFEIRSGELCLTVTNATTGHSVPPTASIVLSPLAPAPAQRGIAQTFTAAVTDLGGNPVAGLPVSINVSGANTTDLTATSDSRGIATFTYASGIVGTDNIKAFALYGGTPIISNTVAQTWTNAPAVPLIGAASPAQGTVITSPTPISASIGAPSGATITDWTVSYQNSAPGSPSVGLAAGNGTPPATLATFDPTVLANGPYTISIAADASDGSREVLAVNVIVSGNLKLGRYGVTYQDANVAVGGIPISVTRSYDSFDKSTGAFGVGWQLGVANFRVYTNGALGTGGWSQYATSCFMAGLGGGLCQMAWATARPHFVTVVWPDGHTETFDFTPTGGSNLFWLGNSAFTARSGSTSSLAVVGDGSLSYNGDGNLYAGIGGPVFAPTRFTLTAKDGTAYVLDTASGLISEADRVGNSVTVDSAGIHSSLGPSITFVRDGAGRISELDKPDGTKVTYAYDTAGNLASVTDERNKTVTYHYDADHNLTETLDPDGHPLRTVTYWPDGRLKTVTDGAGNVSTVSSDPSSLQQVVSDPNGQLTTINSFDANGNLVEVSQVFGGQTLNTTRHYDAFGRVTDLTDPLGNHSQWTYDESSGSSNGNLLSYTDASGYTLTFGNYSAFGQAGTVAGPDDSVLQTSTYDPKTGLLLATQRPGMPATTYTYYANGLKHTANNGSGITMTYGYDSAGHLTSETDAKGQTTAYGFNADGQLTSVTDQSGNLTNYTYDPHGNLSSVRDADGVVYTYGYDDRNRLVSAGDPSHSTTYTYDDQGRVQQRTDRNGQVTTYAYDSHGQVTRETRPGNDVTQFSYDPLERLVEAENASSEVTFAYDNASRVSEQVTCAPQPNGAPCQSSSPSSAMPTVTVDYTWDKDGHQTSVTDPAGKTIYGFNGNGLLGTITDPSGGAFALSYDADSRPSTMSMPNGIVATTKYDSSGLVASVDSTLGSAVVDQEDYTLDPATGQRTSLTDSTGTDSYTYQPNGALASSTVSGQPSDTYTWDPSGNIASLPGIGASSISYDKNGRLASAGSVTYGYDAEGNLISRADAATGSWTHYTWNVDHQLISVDGSDGSHTSYKYDPLGRRVESNQSGNVTRYGWDAFNLVGEYDGSNALVASYVTGPTNASVYDATTPAEALESTRSGSTLYYLHNAQGSTVAATRPDGSVAYRNSYSAFGDPTLGNPADAAYAYAGAQFDSATGFYYMRDRYYDPSVGRFISEDPQAADYYALPLGSWTHYSRSLDLRTPLALNRYTYAGADPIDYVDPSGDFGLPAIGLQVGRAIACGAICLNIYMISGYAGYSTTIHSPEAQDLSEEVLDCEGDGVELLQDEALTQADLGLDVAAGTPAGDLAPLFADDAQLVLWEEWEFELVEVDWIVIDLEG